MQNSGGTVTIRDPTDCAAADRLWPRMPEYLNQGVNAAAISNEWGTPKYVRFFLSDRGRTGGALSPIYRLQPNTQSHLYYVRYGGGRAVIAESDNSQDLLSAGFGLSDITSNISLGDVKAAAQKYATNKVETEMKKLGALLENERGPLIKKLDEKVKEIEGMIKAAGPDVSTAILQLAYVAQPELLPLKGIPFGERAAKYVIGKAVLQAGRDVQKFLRVFDQQLGEFAAFLKRGNASELTAKIGL
jgi:hypothetical protein